MAKWYDKPKQKAVKVEVCRDCGSQELEKFTAGGMIQVRCKKCQSRHSLCFDMPVRETDVVIDTAHGPQVIREKIRRQVPATDQPLEHERDPRSFRNPAKNYNIDEE